MFLIKEACQILNAVVESHCCSIKFQTFHITYILAKGQSYFTNYVVLKQVLSQGSQTPVLEGCSVCGFSYRQQLIKTLRCAVVIQSMT